MKNLLKQHYRWDLINNSSSLSRSSRSASWRNSNDKGVLHRSQGYTLVELLVSIAVFSLLITISYTTVVASFKATRRAEAMRDVQNEARAIVDFISRDIKSNPGDPLIIISGDTFTVGETMAGNARTYTYDISARTIPGCWLTYDYPVAGTGRKACLHSSNVKIGKINPTAPVFEPTRNQSNYLVISNLQIESTKGGKPYKFTIDTAIAK